MKRFFRKDSSMVNEETLEVDDSNLGPWFHHHDVRDLKEELSASELQVEELQAEISASNHRGRNPWKLTVKDPPEKNGPYFVLKRYELKSKNKVWYEECIRIFNTEHNCWDAEDGDDFDCCLGVGAFWTELVRKPLTETLEATREFQLSKS